MAEDQKRLTVPDLKAKKRAKELGADLGPKFDEIVESARTGKILDKYDL